MSYICLNKNRYIMDIQTQKRVINGKEELILITRIPQKEGLQFGLPRQKGKKPFCVVYGENQKRGVSYDLETAIQTAK